MKYSLEESLQRLRNELNKLLKQTTSINSSTHRHVTEKPKSHHVDDWSETEVKEWFVKNNINISILEHLSPCSGVVLKQMFEMRKIAPEFFYHSLEKANRINLSALTLFTHFLVKLMEESA